MLLQWLLHLHTSLLLVLTIRISGFLQTYIEILCETHCVPQVSLFHTDKVGCITYAYAGTCMLICFRKWDFPRLCCFAFRYTHAQEQMYHRNPKNLKRALKKETNKHSLCCTLDMNIWDGNIDQIVPNNYSHQQILKWDCTTKFWVDSPVW